MSKLIDDISKIVKFNIKGDRLGLSKFKEDRLIGSITRDVINYYGCQPKDNK